jgi:hypothetical protein
MLKPGCLSTTLGSLPHTDVVRGTRLMKVLVKGATDLDFR